jgi:hypothetical protein
MFGDKTHKWVFSDREYEKEKKRFSGFLQLPSPNYIPFDLKDAKSWILAPTLQHTAVVIDKNAPIFGNVAATQNVCECVNVSFHNPQTQKAGQAHLDIYTNISSIFPALKTVQGGSLKDVVTITMTSSYMSERFSDIYCWIKKQGFNVNYVDISYDQTGKVGNNQNPFFMRTTKNYFEFIYPYSYYSQYLKSNRKLSPQPESATRHLAITAGCGSLIYIPNSGPVHDFLKTFENSVWENQKMPFPLISTPVIVSNPLIVGYHYTTMGIQPVIKPNYSTSYFGMPIQYTENIGDYHQSFNAGMGNFLKYIKKIRTFVGYDVMGKPMFQDTFKPLYHYHSVPGFINYRSDLIFPNNQKLQEICEYLQYFE